ncbi:histidine--tRNA ligase, putative [Plasmodium ovale]|nr:histidine--tRNA ligase, putative [Plasmodium ovale]
MPEKRLALTFLYQVRRKISVSQLSFKNKVDTGKMSISIYKNKVFSTKDVVEVSIYEKSLKLEPSSFKDTVYKLNENRINVEELEKIDETGDDKTSDGKTGDGKTGDGKTGDVLGGGKEKTQGERENGQNISEGETTAMYDIDELKCLYFFFLINMLRFKNNLDFNLIRNVCSSINNVECSSKVPLGENYLYSETLKKFFLANLKKCGRVEYNLNDFNTGIDIVIEKCSMMFINVYKTVTCSKYLTCCVCSLFELFNIDCDILFRNPFNNNVNNSNIQSVNDLISKIKWMIHDSKIEKDKELSKSISSNVLLFVYAQSKLTDECEYFRNIINQNFKNSIDNYKSDYSEEMHCINSYINILCKNINDNFFIHVKNMLNFVEKILPIFVTKLHDFIASNEAVSTENVDLKKPPSDAFLLYCDGDKKNEKSFLLELYHENYFKSMENKFLQVKCSNELQRLKEINTIFNDLLILLTDMILHMNILYDIKAYNKAVAQLKKNKKVTGYIHNIGVGCIEFKNFLYSIITSKENKSQEKQTRYNMEIITQNKIVTNHLFNTLSKNFTPHMYNEEINEILLQKNINFNLKVPKGAKDFNGEDMQLRNIFFDYIKGKFLVHGAVEIDTPIFELKETLTDKYGEDAKLIFDLKDQGGENLSLRYDLTVPLYRFVNTNNISTLKRFHIGKVYRRDEPSMNRGRFREFYQCDFDIVGKYDILRTDFHILYIFWDILNNLKNVIGNFNCKINHRKILEYMLLSCNIHKDKIKTVSSSIDKLDKITFQQFRDELLNEKGIPVESVDKIESYISKTLSLSPFLVIEFLRNDLNESIFNESYKNDIYKIINHLEDIFELLKYFNMLHNFSFDLSLARGLDYYTGIIFEFILLSENGLGSIAAGGRYDYLIRNKRREYIPSVGASVGIERIITIAENMVKKKCLLSSGAGITATNDSNSKGNSIAKDHPRSTIHEDNFKFNLKDNSVEVLICNIKKNCFKEIIELSKKLWEENISTEFTYVKDQKIQKQLVYALEKQIPLVIIIGDEIEQGIIKLREMTQDKEKSGGEREINLNDCVAEIKNYFKHNLTWKQNITNILFRKKGTE